MDYAIEPLISSGDYVKTSSESLLQLCDVHEQTLVLISKQGALFDSAVYRELDRLYVESVHLCAELKISRNYALNQPLAALYHMFAGALLKAGAKNIYFSAVPAFSFSEALRIRSRHEILNAIHTDPNVAADKYLRPKRKISRRASTTN